MKKILISILLLTNLFAVYNIGQTISQSDQNVTLNVCDSSSDLYGDPVKLADYNGATNGGDYHVIWLEMSASW